MAQDAIAPLPEEWPFTDAATRRLMADARAARSLARRYCQGCGWYHGSWTWWRALGLASGADLHREFFRAAAGPLTGCPRILVSGTGDSALLAVAADTLGEALTRADLHVLDRCDTPLHLCHRFARETDLSIRTHTCDILEFNREDRFELILVHAFLGFFAPSRRQKLFRLWHSLLAPGGRLLMVQRIRPASEADLIRFAVDEGERFAHRVMETGRDVTSDAELTALAGAAREYVAHKRTHPVSGTAELLGLAEGAGLRILESQVASTATPAGAVPGPTLRSGAPYAQLVAVRAH